MATAAPVAPVQAPPGEVIVSDPAGLGGAVGPPTRGGATQGASTWGGYRISAHPPCAPQPWELFEEKMAKAGLSEAAKGAFKQNYEQLVAGVTGLVGGWGASRAAGGAGACQGIARPSRGTPQRACSHGFSSCVGGS